MRRGVGPACGAGQLSLTLRSPDAPADRSATGAARLLCPAKGLCSSGADWSTHPAGCWTGWLVAGDQSTATGRNDEPGALDPPAAPASSFHFPLAAASFFLCGELECDALAAQPQRRGKCRVTPTVTVTSRP